MSTADLIEVAIRDVLAVDHRRPLVVGLCGAQGSGKSTVCSVVSSRFRAAGLNAATLSLDDLYLPGSERRTLAADVHPLFRTRGVPGTHNVALGIATLEALGGSGPVRLPRFDKATDERCPNSRWDVVNAPMDIVLFEGWCVGAGPQSADALETPVNQLESQEDPDGRWRRHVNAVLAGDYQRLFARIDFLVFLAAPDFGIVRQWRTQQEHELRDQAQRTHRESPKLMSDAELARFIQHYERLTRHMLVEMPARADLVLRLDSDRAVVGEPARRSAPARPPSINSSNGT